MLISSIALLVLLASPAVAGRNANGALVVHVARSPAYTACDLSGEQICGIPVPGSCGELVTQVDDDVPTIFLLASWTEIASPGVSAIRFGITHNLPTDHVYWPASTCWNLCVSGASEFQDADWPGGGGDGRSGNIVTFSAPIYDRLFKFYCFVLEGIYLDGGPYFFATSPYSEADPALFYDDATPPNTDICANFGIARWLEVGNNDCPQIPPASVDDAPVRITAVGPNPCVGRATFTVFLTASGAVRVQILDLQGRRIATLVDGALPAGSHEVVWNAAGASSGIYLARLTTPAGVRSTKLILLD
jgi:hypothetical protein